MRHTAQSGKQELARTDGPHQLFGQPQEGPKGYARRRFLFTTVLALPAVSALASCVGEREESEPFELDEDLAARELFVGDGVSARERHRRGQLVAARTAAANRHDLERLMRQYAQGAELVINGDAIRDPDRIRSLLVRYGLSRQAGGLADTRLTPQQTYISDEEILVTGYITGRHVGVLAGFAPTERDVSMAYAAFYRFDRNGQLASERLTINLGMLSSNLMLPSS